MTSFHEILFPLDIALKSAGGPERRGQLYGFRWRDRLDHSSASDAAATLWKKLNAGNKAAVPGELAKWSRAGGRVIAGLVRRRKAEGLMFKGDVKGALALAHS